MKITRIVENAFGVVLAFAAALCAASLFTFFRNSGEPGAYVTAYVAATVAAVFGFHFAFRFGNIPIAVRVWLLIAASMLPWVSSMVCAFCARDDDFILIFMLGAFASLLLIINAIEYGNRCRYATDGGDSRDCS